MFHLSNFFKQLRLISTSIANSIANSFMWLLRSCGLAKSKPFRQASVSISKPFRQVSVSISGHEVLSPLVQGILFNPDGSGSADYDRKLVRYFDERERPIWFEDFLRSVTRNEDFIEKQLGSSPQGMGNFFLKQLVSNPLPTGDQDLFFEPDSPYVQTAYEKLPNDDVSICSSLFSFLYRKCSFGTSPKFLANKYNPDLEIYEVTEVSNQELEKFKKQFDVFKSERKGFISLSDIESFCKELIARGEAEDGVFMPISSACADLSYSSVDGKMTLHDLKILVPQSQGEFEDFVPQFENEDSLKQLYQLSGVSVPDNFKALSFPSTPVTTSDYVREYANMLDARERRTQQTHRTRNLAAALPEVEKKPDRNPDDGLGRCSKHPSIFPKKN